MKVTKQMHGYTMRLTDGEFAVLSEMVRLGETPSDVLWNRLDTASRRSYSRRCGQKLDKDFLRVDRDRRGDA